MGVYMIYDYYDFDSYNLYLDKFFNEVDKVCDYNKFNDVFLSYLENREKFLDSYDIDEDAYLCYLVRIYALNGKLSRMKFLNHPYITSYKIDKDKNNISTIFGNLDFKFWIKGYSDAFLRAYKEKGNDVFKIIKAYLDVYNGKYNGRCHEVSMKFCFGNTIVTAFMHEPLSKLRYLHSFITTGDSVLDATANLVINKDDYYRLKKPEIVTEISGCELYDFYHEYRDKYPKLRYMSLKQLLVEYDEIRKHPETVKVKKWKR